MPELELYTTPGCPYCARVKRTLEELDLEYEEHSVPTRKSKRTTVKEVSGQSGVPVLVDTENGVDGMPESQEIIRYLKETYGT